MLLKSLFISIALIANAHAVNLNSATAEEIDSALTNVGPIKAEAIVAYRTEHGPFKSVADLDLVKGIGPATLKKNKEVLEFSTIK